MNINKGNYEIWFIDYHDGNLTPQQVADLFLFLEEHPEFKAEFEGFENIKVVADDISFDLKESLKKSTISAENFNEYAVAHIEGDLNPAVTKEYLNAVENNPAFKKEHLLFAKTKLVVNASIKFADKESLKRKAGRIIPVSFIRYAVAACLLIIAGVYFFNADKPVKTQQADVLNPKADIAAPIENKDSFFVDKADAVQNQTKTEQKIVQANNSPNLAEVKTEKNSSIATKENKANDNYIASKNNKNDFAKKSTEKQNERNQFIIETLPSIAANAIALPKERLEAIPLAYIENSYTMVMQQNQRPGKFTPELLKAQDVVKEQAIKRLNTFAESNETEESLPSSPKKLKLLAVVGAVVNKVTFKQVNIETRYSPEGDLTAYQVTAGKLNFEKQVSK